MVDNVKQEKIMVYANWNCIFINFEIRNGTSIFLSTIERNNLFQNSIIFKL